MFCAYLVSYQGKPKYVGITSTSVEKRWRTHKTKAAQGFKSALYDAIRAIGAHNLQLDWIASATSWANLQVVERELITSYETFHTSGGWNLTLGGDGFFGGTWPEEAKQRVSKLRKGVKRDPAIAAKTAARLRGKKLSAEHAAKARSTLARHRKEHGPANKGQAKSDETRKKLREAWARRKEKWACGMSPKCLLGRVSSASKQKARWRDPSLVEENAKRIKKFRENTPKTHSAASKAKMSASAKARCRRPPVSGQGTLF